MSGNVRMEGLLQEIIKMSYEELKKRCRMCCCPLQQEGIHTIQLFTPENRHVVDQIWTYLRIKIEETDPFSSHICYNCYEKFYTLGSKIQEFRRIQDIQFENKEYINKFSRENNNIVSPTLYQPAGSVEPSDHNDWLDDISSDEEDGELSDGEKESEKNLKRKESDNRSSPLEEGEIRDDSEEEVGVIYPEVSQTKENMTNQVPTEKSIGNIRPNVLSSLEMNSLNNCVVNKNTPPQKYLPIERKENFDINNNKDMINTPQNIGNQCVTSGNPASSGRSVGNDADAEHFPYPNEENMTGQSTINRKRKCKCSGPINRLKRRYGSLIILTPEQINERHETMKLCSLLNHNNIIRTRNIQTASSSQESQQNFAHQIPFNVECSFQIQPIQQVTVQQPNHPHQMYGNTIFSSQENDGHFI